MAARRFAFEIRGNSLNRRRVFLFYPYLKKLLKLSEKLTFCRVMNKILLAIGLAVIASITARATDDYGDRLIAETEAYSARLHTEGVIRQEAQKTREAIANAKERGSSGGYVDPQTLQRIYRESDAWMARQRAAIQARFNAETYAIV